MGTKVQGLAIGAVVNVNDPMQQGRVQLQLPSILGDVVGAWAPVVNGKTAADGSRIDPQPGDGAIVGFVDGDADAPIVIGWQVPQGTAPAAPSNPAIPSATDLALRAITVGLLSARAIDAAQVRGIMATLKEAAGAAQGRREPETAKALLKLMRGLHTDTAAG